MFFPFREINSAVEFLPYKQAVTGSNPVSPIIHINTMKKKKLNELIQKPLRFHHQDIHEELEDIKRMIIDVSNQMQELREAIGRPPNTDEKLPMREPYQHPWYEYKRQELTISGNYIQPETEEDKPSSN